MERGTENKPGRVPTGIRGLFILEVLAKNGAPMTPTDINEVVGLPKPTIHRLCQRLEAEGFLEKDLDGRRYLPGSRLRTISAGVTGFSNFTQARHAVLARLAEKIGETCNITIPTKAGMQYLDRVETRWPLRIQFPAGSHVPFYCTASGKLYLSLLRKSQRLHFVDTLLLEKHARNTVTEKDELLGRLDEIRRDRLGTDNEEFVDGMVAVAVPVEDPTGKLIATLALHAPTQRMSIDEALTHTDDLRAAADKISQIFQATGGADDAL